MILISIITAKSIHLRTEHRYVLIILIYYYTYLRKTRLHVHVGTLLKFYSKELPHKTKSSTLPLIFIHNLKFVPRLPCGSSVSHVCDGDKVNASDKCELLFLYIFAKGLTVFQMEKEHLHDLISRIHSSPCRLIFMTRTINSHPCTCIRGLFKK